MLIQKKLNYYEYKKNCEVKNRAEEREVAVERSKKKKSPTKLVVKKNKDKKRVLEYLEKRRLRLRPKSYQTMLSKVRALFDYLDERPITKENIDRFFDFLLEKKVFEDDDF